MYQSISFFSNEVDLSQERSVVILCKRRWKKSQSWTCYSYSNHIKTEFFLSSNCMNLKPGTKVPMQQYSLYSSQWRAVFNLIEDAQMIYCSLKKMSYDIVMKVKITIPGIEKQVWYSVYVSIIICNWRIFQNFFNNIILQRNKK